MRARRNVKLNPIGEKEFEQHPAGDALPVLPLARGIISQNRCELQAQRTRERQQVNPVNFGTVCQRLKALALTGFSSSLIAELRGLAN
jgi:hypothetical protein